MLGKVVHLLEKMNSLLIMIKGYIQQYWLIALIILAALAFVIFLFVKNQKDKKALINKFNNDFEKTRNSDTQVDF